MRTEKVTINLSLTELGAIDYLVEKGTYASRSEFIRLAIRKQTEQHDKDIAQFLEPPFLAEAGQNYVRNFGGVGVLRLSQSDVEELLTMNRRIKIRVVGILVVDDGITPEQIKQTVADAQVYGKVFADDAVKAAMGL